MNEAERLQKERERQDDLARLRGLRPIDDDVNGAYWDDSDIGRLMHDFSCSDPNEMHFDLLRDTARYYKENPKGVDFMCRAFEYECQ